MIVYKRKKAPNKKEVNSKRKYERQWKEWERRTFENKKKEKNKNV